MSKNSLYLMNFNNHAILSHQYYSQMKLPQGTLVMMVKRGKTILVPNGQLPMEEGDILLCLTDQQNKASEDISVCGTPSKP